MQTHKIFTYIYFPIFEILIGRWVGGVGRGGGEGDPNVRKTQDFNLAINREYLHCHEACRLNLKTAQLVATV